MALRKNHTHAVCQQKKAGGGPRINKGEATANWTARGKGRIPCVPQERTQKNCQVPVIQEFGKLRQEDLEFKTNLGYKERPCLIKRKKKNCL
jgi:hypothetical protein